MDGVNASLSKTPRFWEDYGTGERVGGASERGRILRRFRVKGRKATWQKQVLTST